MALSIFGYLFFQNRGGISDLAERSLHWTNCAIAFGLAAVNVLLSFFRWYLLVRAQEFPFRVRDAFRIGFLGYIFNFVGAGAVGGDVVKAVLIIKEQKSRRTVAVATILLDRVLGLLTLFMVGATAAMFQIELIERSAELQVLTGILWGGSAFGLLGLSLLMHPAVPRWSLLKSAVRLPFVGRFIAELIHGIVLYQEKRRVLVAAVVVSLAAHLSGLSAFYFCSQALQAGREVPAYSTQLLLIPAAVVVEVVVPLPGGIGALEAAVRQCYVIANHASAAPVPKKLAAEAGFFTALVFRVITLLIAALGGCYYITARKELKNLLQHSPDMYGERGGEQLSQPSHD